MHIAMEYIAHGDLGQYIKKNRAMAKSDVKEITTQILRALVALHGKGICHRDLKPQVMYSSIGSVTHTDKFEEYSHGLYVADPYQAH